MPETQRTMLRFTCPPCGEVFAAQDEDALIAVAVEHARRLHDLHLLSEFGIDELRRQVRRENEAYWDVVRPLLPEGRLKTVLEERLGDREREIVRYVVHGFTNGEIARRLNISARTVSTHLVNVYEKLHVHSRAELTAVVRAADRIIEAGLRADSAREYGPFTRVNGPSHQ